ncbi:MAG: CBS domain-containing protein [Gammaproteobacteria bacterium]|nr:CBS domain-containing protein [Gammaproteobacteria bacterium]
MARRRVRDIIARRDVVQLRADSSIRSACKLMAEQGVGAVLVMDGEKVEGIFTERDALKRVLAEGLDPDAGTLGEVMTRDIVTLAPDDWAVDALRLMSQVGIRHLLVVEQEKLIGVISLRDFIGAEFQLAGKPD